MHCKPQIRINQAMTKERKKNDFDIVLSKDAKGVRADKFLAEKFPQKSRSLVQESFDAEQVFLNGQCIEKKQKLPDHGRLHGSLLEPEAITVEAVNIGLDILFEDDDIIVVNKASGMVVHPGSGTDADTLVHALLHHTAGKLSPLGGEERPGIVHRLDKETTGVIIAAKSDIAYHSLTRQFSSHAMRKIYYALIKGVPHVKSGSIKETIGRHPQVRTKMAVVRKGGRVAHTDWVLLETFGTVFSAVRCHLHTGRTHQIRVHMRHTGHPLVGDTVYGYAHTVNAIPKPPHFFLHAEELEITHPRSGESLNFKAPLPAAFTEYVAMLRQHFGGNSVA